jgi:small subunit ribosomal protein S20
VKSVLEAVETKDPEAAKAALVRTVPAIAKAAAKGAFHKKTASRKISRLTKRVNTLKG